jgi:adenylate cyclase
MANEIEHKYLVTGDFRPLATKVSHIVQGYLSSNIARTVRVRIRDDRAYLTIKGPSTADGLARAEFEYEIPVSDAEALLKLCEPGVVEKKRYLVPWKNHTVEVDEFMGDNAGLVMAEIEVSSREETVDLPGFIGEEVTGDKRYYNSQLRQNPYKNWK